MELVTIKQMQDADKRTVQDFGIYEIELMQNAAMALSHEVVKIIYGLDNKKVAIFCGPGNNGGDGWALAIILDKLDISTTVFSTCELSILAESAKYYSKIVIDLKVEIIEKKENIDLEEYSIVVDAIFGIGLSRKITGLYKKYINKINSSKAYVISADIPSGLYSDEGIPYDIAVNADVTVCFGKAKIALFSQPGFSFSKAVIVDDIGIPAKAYKNSLYTINSVNKEFVESKLKKRKEISSKGSYGKILILGGSPGMTGAVALCSKACFRSGAGLVYCAVPKSKLYEYDGLLAESISIPVKDNGKEYISDISAEDISFLAKGKSAIIIGPGLSNESASHIILKEIIASSDCPIIVDAQALNHVSKYKDILKGTNRRLIITPHPGEMAKLTGKTVDQIQKSRINTAVEFANKYEVIVLLKGHKTIVTDGEMIFVNTTGNPGMATAGSGDVLAGIVASFVSIHKNLTEAIALAMYVHGAAGDKATDKYGECGMMARDIIKDIPYIIKEITGA